MENQIDRNMGYSTWYIFRVLNVSEEREREIEEAFGESSIVDAPYILEGEEVRNWYTQDEDMMEFSKRFPDAIIELEAQGENTEDLWKTRYKNGEAEVVTWVYKPFQKLTLEKERIQDLEYCWYTLLNLGIEPLVAAPIKIEIDRLKNEQTEEQTDGEIQE